VADTAVISTSWDGMTCRSFIHELSREQPKATNELLDIATQHTSGKEAVGAAFTLGNAGTAAGGG
jgi:hypothetical protein